MLKPSHHGYHVWFSAKWARLMEKFKCWLFDRFGLQLQNKVTIFLRAFAVQFKWLNKQIVVINTSQTALFYKKRSKASAYVRIFRGKAFREDLKGCESSQSEGGLIFKLRLLNHAHPLLDLLQGISVLFKMLHPGLDTLFQMQPDQCRTDEQMELLQYYLISVCMYFEKVHLDICCYERRSDGCQRTQIFLWKCVAFETIRLYYTEKRLFCHYVWLIPPQNMFIVLLLRVKSGWAPKNIRYERASNLIPNRQVSVLWKSFHRCEFSWWGVDCMGNLSLKVRNKASWQGIVRNLMLHLFWSYAAGFFLHDSQWILSSLKGKQHEKCLVATRLSLAIFSFIWVRSFLGRAGERSWWRQGNRVFITPASNSFL